MLKSWQNNWRQIVCPPKFIYSPYDIGDKYRDIEGYTFERVDFNFKNQDGLTQVGVLFKNNSLPTKACLIYLHSHSSSLLEGLSLLKYCSPEFNLCIFDSRASGLSEGEFVTLGIKESDDLEVLIKKLRAENGMREFYLWGRSMGAVTAIIHSNRQDRELVKAVVLDSPFTTAKTMVRFILI